jgi:hypothetical protein
MERNKWETAVRCLEAGVQPDAGDAAVLAAVDGFRRIAKGTPLSQICIEFACGGVPLAVLAQMKESLERLNRDNLELRRKVAADEVARAGGETRLDAAYRRIHELTQEALAARRQADAAEREPAGDPAVVLETGSGRLRAAGRRQPQPA